jgi:hypothetical protein
MTDEAVEYAHDYFSKMYNSRTKNFANAREVRNYFERVVKNQSNRIGNNISINKEKLTVIEKVDME